MIFRFLFWLFALGLRVADAWERFDQWMRAAGEPQPPAPRPMFFGWCLDCGPEGTVERVEGRRRRVRYVTKGGTPTFLTPDWRCERCGSRSVLNIRAGGDAAVRA